MNFKEWLDQNRQHFKDYDPYELAQVAKACGWTLGEICPDVSEWVTASQRRLRLWNSPFFIKWLSATSAQNGREDA